MSETAETPAPFEETPAVVAESAAEPMPSPSPVEPPAPSEMPHVPPALGPKGHKPLGVARPVQSVAEARLAKVLREAEIRRTLYT